MKNVLNYICLIQVNEKFGLLLVKKKNTGLILIQIFVLAAGYYFGMIKNKTPCYHLESIFKAKKENKFEIIEFVDDEYESFISGIISDL